MKFILKIKSRIGRIYYSKVMNTNGTNFNMGVIVNNSQCIYLGKGAGIGGNTFL